MRKVLQTIVRDTEKYSISNSSELSLSKPDLYIEKIALQGGETATTDDIVVTRSGKNLFDKSLFREGADLANCTLIATTENGWIIKGKDYNQIGNSLYYNGWFRPLDYEYSQGRGLYFNKGDIVTVSADYTVLENPYPNSSYPANIYLYGDKSQTPNLSKLPPLNITERRSKTFTISASGRYYPVFTLNSATIKIENIQVEIGSTATTYEPYLSSKSLTFSRDYLLSLKGVNNLLDKSKFSATQTINGITFTNNGDGTITVDGTATKRTHFYICSAPYNKGHKVLLKGCPSGGEYSKYFFETSFGNEYGKGAINTLDRDISDGSSYITIGLDFTASNLVFKPELYDLTAIYGEGNEPTTVEQFLKDYPLSSTDKLTITKNSVKYNDTDITSEVTGLDEFFSIDADVSTITTSANIALGEITEDISYSVKSNKRAIYTGENIVYSSQTFIKE